MDKEKTDLQMIDYGKAAVEHALTALTREDEQKVEEILRDGYTAFYRLSKVLDSKARWYARRFQEVKREELAAIVLCAAATLYEWDKAFASSDDDAKRAFFKFSEEVACFEGRDGDRSKPRVHDPDQRT
jgi:AMMECR1 domain-containing protein